MQRLAPMLLAVLMLAGCAATTKHSFQGPLQCPAPQPDLLLAPADPVLLSSPTGGDIEIVHQANARLWFEQRTQLNRLIAWVRRVYGEGRDSILPAKGTD